MNLLQLRLSIASLGLVSMSFAQNDLYDRFNQPIPVVHTVTLGQPLETPTFTPPGWNLVRILPGSTVRLELAEHISNAKGLVWMRDGTVVGQTGDVPFLEISNFRESDGEYWVVFTENGAIRSTGPKRLQATNFSAGSMLNLSSRLKLSADTPALTAGFVISGEGLAPNQSRTVLIRAVGPTLANYGVENPIPDPTLRVWRAASASEIGIGFPAITFADGTTPQSRYYDQIRRVNIAVGAFPIDLPSLEKSAATEAAMLIGLSPGAYTVTVTSNSSATGDALLEVYEVSAEVIAATTGDPPPLVVIEPTP